MKHRKQYSSWEFLKLHFSWTWLKAIQDCDTYFEDSLPPSMTVIDSPTQSLSDAKILVIR